MKKNIFIAISLVIISNAASAAPTWTGLYGGVNGGFVFNNVRLNANQLGFTEMNGKCNSSANFSSFFPGVQIGYVRQLDSKMVVGVEGDYTANANQTTTLGCTCPFNSGVSDQFKFSNRQQGSIRAHVGYALGHLLPFISAGASLADLALKYSNEAGDKYYTQASELGWLIGAGVEWQFLQNWSLRAEYYYTDYDNVNVSIPTVYGLNDPNGGGTAKLKTNTVRAAINYWF